MRLLKRALRALILLAGFLAALWAFMPWREVGSFAMALAASRMERQGMTLTYSGVEDVRGDFSIRDVTLRRFRRRSRRTGPISGRRSPPTRCFTRSWSIGCTSCRTTPSWPL